MPDLFTPIKIGSIEANNRVIMAPLTRARSTWDGVPTEMMIPYYGMRASAGLIISEANGISREALGWAYASGIWNKEQVEHWKPITKEVHDKGGKIICQLWHMGRAVHSKVTGQTPLSASATTYPTKIHVGKDKFEPEQAHALTIDEIKSTIEDYRKAAMNAMEAGFDGVQIHASNGFLLDQFMRDSTNFRTDEYGGGIPNRLRIFEEVIAAIVAAIGADQTHVRLSPNGDSQGVIDSNHRVLFTEAAKILENYHVASMELRENSTYGTFWGTTDQPKVHDSMREVYHGVLILNQDYNKETANGEIQGGVTDAVSFGRKFIANPDLVHKLKYDKPIREYNDLVKWWYSQGPEGYLEFPGSSEKSEKTLDIRVD